MKPLSTFCLSFTLITLCLNSLGQTGITNPYMTTCDNYVSNFLEQYDIPGATLTITRHGKTVYMRAFGYANLAETELMHPYHRFRIASLSKPITAITIMKMVEDGLLNLDDTVFGENGLLANDPQLSHVEITDTRIYNITLRQLLNHSAGWNSGINCFPDPTTPYPYFFGGCDPIVAPLHVTQVTGTSNPVSKAALIEFLLEKGLDHEPGSQYAYSNIAYLMIGRVIEHLTGMSYEEYVQQTILEPLGICDMTIAKNLLSEKQEREVEYKGEGYNNLSIYGTGQYVPWEYGGFNINAMDAHGGWIATANELVKLLVAVDRLDTKPDILSSSTITTMTTPSNVNTEYALGWGVTPNGVWSHTGAVDGTATLMVRNQNGYTWSMLLNKRITGTNSNAFWNAFVNIPWNCITGITTNVTYDLMLHPSENAQGISAINIGNNQIELSWSPGNGDGRLLVVSKNYDITSFPLDGQEYDANAVYGVGDDLGNENYVLYNGSENSVIISDLNADDTYYFRLFEYNQNTETGNIPLYRLCDGGTLIIEHNNVSVKEYQTEAFSLKLMPNPAEDRFQIMTSTKLHSLNIYDAQGALIRSENTQGKSWINITDLSAGLYIVKAIDEQFNSVQKIFVKK